MIRVLIVDDQALLRDGIKVVLDLNKDMEVVGTAKNGLEALELVDACHPDVVLLDIRMPVMDGVECTRIIKEKYPDIHVIILTTFDDEEYIIDALAYGASGYLLKDIEKDKLVEAIRDAVQKKMVIPPEVANKLSSGLLKISTGKAVQSHEMDFCLTERESEIAQMLVKGFTNKQISSSLYISEGTVRNYISGIYSKMGVTDRVQAVICLKSKGVG